MTKQQFLASRPSNVIKGHQESFLDILDEAWQSVNEGRDADAKKSIGEADALWKKVKKVHGVEL